MDSDDVGRGAHIPIPAVQNAFKTPTLRNVDIRDPYLHNGSEKTLRDVVLFYNKGGKKRRSSVSESVRPLGLSEQEVDDLVDFMKTLTSKDAPVTVPVLPR